MKKTIPITAGGSIAILALTALLIILKAANLIDLPWLWVFAPIWVPWGIAVVMILLGALIVVGTFGFWLIMILLKVR